MHLEHSVIPPVSDDKLRRKIRHYYLKDESQVIEELIAEARLEERERSRISTLAAELVSRVRADSSPSVSMLFLNSKN